MSQQQSTLVTGRDGLRGRIVETRPLTGGVQQVLVEFDTGQRVWLPNDILTMDENGSYQVALSANELSQQVGVVATRSEDTVVLPVVEETLVVSKRQVSTGGVRVHKYVREREEVVDEPLLRETVQVERVSINRLVNGPVDVWYDGETMVVPIVEEVLVVEKRLMVKEELRITKQQTTEHQPQTVTLRSEEVTVEQIDPQTRPLDAGRDRA